MSWLENKVVLVTGASGFIGKHLISRLSKVSGIRLLSVSRNPPLTNDPSLSWFKGELSELTRDFWLKQKITKIDVVFHLGAFIPKNQSTANDIEEVYTSNLDGTRTLLEGLPKGVLRVIFSSSIDVYALPKEGKRLEETSQLEPPSLYGSSKLFCEHLIKVWAGQHCCSYAILRYGHIYGPGEEAYGKLIPIAIQQVLAGKKPVVFGNGRAKRSFLYVDDVIEATVRAAEIQSNIEPLNIVSGEAQPIRKIVELIIKQSGAKLSIEFLSEKNEGHSLIFSNQKMIAVLGDWQFESLEKGLLDEIKSVRRVQNEIQTST